MNDQIITKEDGKPFDKKGAAAMVLNKKGLNSTYEVAEYEGGGFVGVPKKKSDSTKDKETLSSKPKTKVVRVHRASGAPENKDLQISVCVNSASNRKKFYPGEEVELTLSEIGVLRDSVEENTFYIPPDSGIYSAKEPLVMARNQYPGMAAQYDSSTGQIKVIKRTPNYLIEEILRE